VTSEKLPCKLGYIDVVIQIFLGTNDGQDPQNDTSRPKPSCELVIGTPTSESTFYYNLVVCFNVRLVFLNLSFRRRVRKQDLES